MEDSLRLRALALVGLWLAALGLLWAGGDLRIVLTGAAIGTVGHVVSWHRRRQRSRVWPLAIAMLVIAVSFIMRTQMLEALAGNWVPLGQFLVLVQALSSFDLRTRGGLYASLTLSGIILFFASQQAFSLVFGVFLVAYVVLLLAFLSLAFLEDGVRLSQVHWRHRPVSMVSYWIATACAVFALSGLAFWIMPRGDGNPIGLPQVAVLPFSQATLDGPAIVPDIDPRSIPQAPGLDSENIVPAPDQSTTPSPLSQGDAGDDLSGGEPGGGDGAAGHAAHTAFVGMESAVGGVGGAGDTNDVVFFVRSKVASYWKGRDLSTFDGQYWLAPPRVGNVANFSRQRGEPHLRYNRESFGLDNRIRYGQTFFIQRDQPDVLFAGYRGLRVIAEEGSLAGYGVRSGDSYRVLSAYPRFTTERLRLDRAGEAPIRYLALPEGSERLEELARRLGQGADSDFNVVERIIGFLTLQTVFDQERPFDLTSSASLEEFLFEAKSGSALDYATATVMLARASGLPSRLAVGYLPGVRDPLSGSYMVRETDAHAWAEVFFQDHGWVPLDTAPRKDIAVAGRTAGRVGYLFQSGVGEQAYQAVRAAPSRLAELFALLVGQRVLWLAAGAVSMVLLALRWYFTRPHRGRSKGASVGWLAYTPLPGETRRELLKVYRQVERLLRQRGVERRRPWQTVGEYQQMAYAESMGGPAVAEQLEWFTQMAWEAAYNPGRLPSRLLQESRERLRLLKRTLKRSGR